MFPRGSVDHSDFTDPVIKGMSVFHCHLLNHEDKGHDGQDPVQVAAFHHIACPRKRNGE
jgi:hypothetical protein